MIYDEKKHIKIIALIEELDTTYKEILRRQGILNIKTLKVILDGKEIVCFSPLNAKRIKRNFNNFDKEGTIRRKFGQEKSKYIHL
jgi:hypothetical protein